MGREKVSNIKNNFKHLKIEREDTAKDIVTFIASNIKRDEKARKAVFRVSLRESFQKIDPIDIINASLRILSVVASLTARDRSGFMREFSRSAVIDMLEKQDFLFLDTDYVFIVHSGSLEYL